MKRFEWKIRISYVWMHIWRSPSECNKRNAKRVFRLLFKRLEFPAGNGSSRPRAFPHFPRVRGENRRVIGFRRNSFIFSRHYFASCIIFNTRWQDENVIPATTPRESTPVHVHVPGFPEICPYECTFRNHTLNKFSIWLCRLEVESFKSFL